MQYIQNYSEPAPVRVLVVDDNNWLREGLITLLNSSSEVRVVGEARSGLEALLLAHSVRPDLVLMDIAMPGIDGLETTRKLKQLQPECQVIMLTFMQEQEYLREALHCGASGYLTKEAGRDELLYAIRSVIKGGTQIQPSMLRTFIQETIITMPQEETVKPVEVPQVETESEIESIIPHLSRRKLEILKLVALGLSNNDIAKKLNVSPSTIKTHVDAIFHKLEVHDRTTATLVAARLGLLDEIKPANFDSKFA